MKTLIRGSWFWQGGRASWVATTTAVRITAREWI
ncbi:MAG: YXWGXW repeat-containing protein [Acidobacteria bacterium]|nr:YXWGXW repeat-containing protein [Acidobacteriota bacterium]